VLAEKGSFNKKKERKGERKKEDIALRRHGIPRSRRLLLAALFMREMAAPRKILQRAESERQFRAVYKKVLTIQTACKTLKRRPEQRHFRDACTSFFVQLNLCRDGTTMDGTTAKIHRCGDGEYRKYLCFIQL